MQVDGIGKYRDILHENIYSCMEMSKQSFEDVINMPVRRFYEYLDWKIKFEESKIKEIREAQKGGKQLI